MRSVLLVLLLAVSPMLQGNAQPPPPIIDMHLHALALEEFAPLVGAPPIPHCVPMTDYPVPETGSRWPGILRSRDLPCRALMSPTTDEDVMGQSLAILARRNVYAVTSGGRLDTWREVEPLRLIPALGFSGAPGSPSADEMARLFKEGRYAVLAEVTTQYLGLSPDAASLEPYWAMAERLDVPVGIHIGTGPVGAPYVGFDKYRARLHSPLGLEEVLVRHPNLRVYIMHAGWPMLDDLLALLWTHPHVYIDTGAIDWALPRAEFHRFLRRVVEAGFGKRVMFGSDQMVWPGALDLAIESLEAADFLSDAQRRDILFNNAARFLRLSPERIAHMHGTPDR